MTSSNNFGQQFSISLKDVPFEEGIWMIILIKYFLCWFDSLNKYLNKQKSIIMWKKNFSFFSKKLFGDLDNHRNSNKFDNIFLLISGEKKKSFI